MSDWGAYFIAGLIGASLGWCVCSIWAVRAIDAVRRQRNDSMQQRQLADTLHGIEPPDTPLMRELRRLHAKEDDHA